MPSPRLLLLVLLATPACWDEPRNGPLDGGGGGEAIVRVDSGRPDEGSRDGEAPDASPQPPYSFVVFGDTQVPLKSCFIAEFPVMKAFTPAIVALAPALVLHVGDVVDMGREPGAYDSFVSCYGELLHPLFPTMGNHDEDWSLGILSYRKFLEDQLFTRNPPTVGASYPALFPVTYSDDPTPYSTDPQQPSHQEIVPSGFSYKTFYAFKHGSSYFLSFEQGMPMWTNTPKTWVEKHLKAARADPSIQHVFVFMHYPLYISTSPEYDGSIGLDPVRKHYEPLFRQYDVTAVFSGHAHVYYHSYVPDDGTPTRKTPPPSAYPHDGRAIHYIVTGGASWPPATLADELKEKSYDYVQARATGSFFTRVQVEGKKLSLSVIGLAGDEKSYTTSVWDHFSIE
jgi:hypothetical protein